MSRWLRWERNYPRREGSAPEGGRRDGDVGEAPATDALGARVAVSHGGREQVQWVRTGSGYLVQSELTLTFGLGDDTSAARVSVRWPDGRERVFEGVPAGTLEARLE